MEQLTEVFSQSLQIRRVSLESAQLTLLVWKSAVLEICERPDFKSQKVGTTGKDNRYKNPNTGGIQTHAHTSMSYLLYQQCPII